MEAALRPFDLGNTQWYVLYLLAHHGQMNQREMTRTLDIERATLSEVLSAPVRKDLIEQTPDPEDQRQKVLHLTTAGRHLFESVPDPIALITTIAFGRGRRGDGYGTARAHRRHPAAHRRQEEGEHRMRILVTGGTGLVGPRLLQRFVKGGTDCPALVRPGKELPPGVAAVEGDILSPDSLTAAVEGVSAIVHLAALVPHPG